MNIVDVLGWKQTDANVEIIQRDATLQEAARKLTAHHIGALVVVDEFGKHVGLISERDLVPAASDGANDFSTTLVENVMSQNVITCGADLNAVDAMLLMQSHGIRHMPVCEGEQLVGMISIRDLVGVCEQLQSEANIDGLTGISNRRHFLETLEKEIERSRRFGRPLSVAMIDIDDFKQVNDHYGHDAGDRVLSALSRLIVQELRTIDSVGRLGGEEFAVIFSETDVANANRACDRILSKIRAAEVDVGETRVSITVTIGLANANPNIRDAKDVLVEADKLLYEGKAQGKDRVVVDETGKGSLNVAQAV